MGSGTFDAGAYRSFTARIKADAGSDPLKLVLTHCDQFAPPTDAQLYSDGPTRKHIGVKRPAETVSC